MFVNYVLSSFSEQKKWHGARNLARGFGQDLYWGRSGGHRMQGPSAPYVGTVPARTGPPRSLQLLSAISGVWATFAGVPQDVLGAVLVSLAKTVDCRLCMGHLRVLLEKTRWIIEDSIDTWADSEFTHDKALKLIVPTQKKQRRIDPHEVACSVALTNDSLGGAALSPPASLTSRDLRRHAEMRMGVLMASTHLTIRPVGVMASIWDGVRLGNPAKNCFYMCSGAFRES